VSGPAIGTPNNEGVGIMPIGGSLALIAVGAVLRFGVTTSVQGLSVGTIGLILMIIGAIGLVISLTMMLSRRRTDVRYSRNGVSYIEPADVPVRRY
jgi:hypothetical protein